MFLIACWIEFTCKRSDIWLQWQQYCCINKCTQHLFFFSRIVGQNWCSSNLWYHQKSMPWYYWRGIWTGFPTFWKMDLWIFQIWNFLTDKNYPFWFSKIDRVGNTGLCKANITTTIVIVHWTRLWLIHEKSACKNYSDDLHSEEQKWNHLLLSTQCRNVRNFLTLNKI